MQRGVRELRIVGGTLRGRKWNFPDAPGLRPTPDRVRETLFNWLAPHIGGARVLDLFAGSGALGFEALSRGAASAVLVESDPRVAEGLREAAKTLGAAGARIVDGDALRYLARTPDRFDLAFVDPPYASGLAVRALAALPAKLKPGARVYVETAAAVDPGGPWRMLREGRAGAVRYALFELDSGASRPGTPQ